MNKSKVEFCGMTFTPKEFTLELPPIDLNDIPPYVRTINRPLSAEVECVMEGTIDAPLLQKLTGVPMDLIDDFTVQFSEPYQEQVRRHKKKRINKKWAKRYGYRTKTRIRTIENVRIKQRGHDEFEFTGLNIFKEKLFQFAFGDDALRKAYERYHQLEAEIEQLTGYDLENLRWLFAAGYTLQRSETEMTLTEFARLIEKENTND